MNPNSFNTMNKTAAATLILGNGFDIGLGYKTRYKDFYESGFFPSKESYPQSAMCLFLHTQALVKGDTWGGIEASLEEYSKLDAKEHTYEQDVLFYQCLCSSFRLYLHRVLYGSPLNGVCSQSLNVPNIESCASSFIQECVLFDRAISQTVSFNYTPFELIAKNICLNANLGFSSQSIENIINSIGVTYVHRGFENEMVLGISNDVQFNRLAL